MSKYTRLNKINHYHDSGSTRKQLDLVNKSSLDSSSYISKPPPSSSLYNNIIRGNSNSYSNSRSISSSINCCFEHNINLNSTSSNANMLRFKSSQAATKSCNNRRRYYNSSKLAFLAIISLLLVLLICINGAHSLNCYHCSSVDDPNCDEAFTGKANITDTDCEKHIGKPAKVCRKIIQYIESKKVVIRSCGFIDDHEEKDRKPMCYKRSGTFAIMMESCNCYTDNCNHSASLVPQRSVLIFASCFVLLYYIITYHLSIGSDTKQSKLEQQ